MWGLRGTKVIIISGTLLNVQQSEDDRERGGEGRRKKREIEPEGDGAKERIGGRETEGCKIEKENRREMIPFFFLHDDQPF